MAIVVVRRNGYVIEMPNGAERFHAELRRRGVTQAVERGSGRTYHVRTTDEGLHLTERPAKETIGADPVLIRTPKLPMNK